MDICLGDDLDIEPPTEIDELRAMLRSAMLQTNGGAPAADRARVDSRELLRILPKPDPFPAKTRDEELSISFTRRDASGLQEERRKQC